MSLSVTRLFLLPVFRSYQLCVFRDSGSELAFGVSGASMTVSVGRRPVLCGSRDCGVPSVPGAAGTGQVLGKRDVPLRQVCHRAGKSPAAAACQHRSLVLPPPQRFSLPAGERPLQMSFPRGRLPS